MIGSLDKIIRPLVLVLPKASRYVKTFKVKIRDKDTNNELMCFHIDDEKLLEKYKTTWTKIEDSKNIELNALPVFDDREIKTKMITYNDKAYTNFYFLNVLEDDVECGSFIIISIDSLLFYEKNTLLARLSW